MPASSCPCSATTGARGARSTALRLRARLPAARASRASCGSSTRRRSSSSTTTPSTAACGSPSCSTARRTRVSARQRRRRRRATQVLDELREARRASCSTTHEHPDGDALGSLAAMQQVLAALGKDAVAFMAADEFPLPYEYRFIQLDGLVTEPPGGPRASARSCSSTAATSTATRPTRSSARARTSSTSTTTTTTRASGRSTTSCPSASCTAEMVWDLMHGLGVEPTPADRRGALRRPGHRHRQLHVREHRRRARTRWRPS